MPAGARQVVAQHGQIGAQGAASTAAAEEGRGGGRIADGASESRFASSDRQQAQVSAKATRKRRADEALGEESTRGMVAFFAGTRRQEVVMLGGVQRADWAREERERLRQRRADDAAAAREQRADRRASSARTNGVGVHGVSGEVDEDFGDG